ncbi:MAG: DUF4268 domain-containing protein [Chitinophagaceae bacterium]|nr:DUF4268 domain-containing protein [Chitinophagaceae bacterium]
MYIINKETNRIEKIETATFKQLGFKEREHLQEWIANNPSCLNEDLLIIQKEFDGFNDTSERLDLLAIDKQGNLVIIENKLDDTGRDVTWQVLKYSSYCSTLNGTQIIAIFNQYLSRIGSTESAESVLEEFLESDDYREKLNIGNSQRIVMIAGEFRKEVTSTVLWLLNYGLRVQCFKAIPYKLGEQLFLNLEQIIPIKEAEDFVISMAKKSREEVGIQEELKERHVVRRKFWTAYIKEINKVSSLYQNVSPGKDHWISAGSGISGVTYTSVVTGDYIRMELSIHGRTQEENKSIFDALISKRQQIESDFGKQLEWERMDDKRMSRIKYELSEVSVFHEEDWDKMIQFMSEVVPKFEAAFKNPISQLSRR